MSDFANSYDTINQLEVYADFDFKLSICGVFRIFDMCIIVFRDTQCYNSNRLILNEFKITTLIATASTHILANPIKTL